MMTRILTGGGLAILAVIVLTAVIIVNPFSTKAAAEDTPAATHPQTDAMPHADAVTTERVARPDSMGQLQATPDSEPETKPYIGVAIYPLSNGSVKVVKVLEDSPSDSVLEAGDIITAVNGEAIDAAKDLTDAIAEAGAGAILTLTITRGNSSMDVTLTVGERAVKNYRKGNLFRKAKWTEDRFASSQFVIADDDGNYHTYRTFSGDITILDASSGTFTLQPKDGSEPIDYTINDDTRIFVGEDEVDDLSGLDVDEQVVVMDVDGEVKTVKQSNPDGPGGFGYRKGKSYMFRPGGGVYHRSFFNRFDDEDIRERVGRLEVGIRARMKDLRGSRESGLGAFRFGQDVESVASLLDGIDDSVLDAYAPDGFEESLERFLEDPGSGGRISVKRDGDGLSVNLHTEDGSMSFTIPASTLNDDDSF